VQASASLLEQQRVTGVSYWIILNEIADVHTWLESPAVSARTGSPALGSPSQSKDEDVNIEYLRNVVLQFLEHPDMRVCDRYRLFFARSLTSASAQSRASVIYYLAIHTARNEEVGRKSIALLWSCINSIARSHHVHAKPALKWTKRLSNPTTAPLLSPLSLTIRRTRLFSRSTICAMRTSQEMK
jgi:hypothetical protein